MRSSSSDDRRVRLRIEISLAVVILVSLTMGVGCANVPEPPPPPPEDGELVTVACGNNRTDDDSLLDWRLSVEPKPIVAGETFSATLGGIATFAEDFLDAAQPIIRGGVKEVDLVALNATVHVRLGAIGADVILTADPKYEYECRDDKADCDPDNGNDDCNQDRGFNPCGRFILLPISSDCDPGGVCEGKGKTGPASQCELNDFCITGALELDLAEQQGRYTASPGGGVVLFGWADESTGFEVRDSGPNEGTWILPMPDYAEPVGPVGLRVTVSGVPVALECTMGVDSKGEYGCNSLDFLSCPSRNEVLISFPIEPAL